MNLESYIKITSEANAEIDKQNALKIAADISYISANREFEDGEKVYVVNSSRKEVGFIKKFQELVRREKYRIPSQNV